MRHAPALLGACLALPLLLTGCGQKGPLYLPEKNAGAVVTAPAPSSAPPAAPATGDAAAPSAPQSAAPANPPPRKNDKDDESQQPQPQPQPRPQSK